MRRSRAIRFGAVWAVVGLSGGLGCVHNHYYYTPSGAPVGVCDPLPPGTVVSSTAPLARAPQVGAVCDEPPQGPFGTQVVQGAARPAPVASNAGAPLFPAPIYSQPRGFGFGPRRTSGNGLAWRASNPEAPATTRIVGDYDDDTTLK